MNQSADREFISESDRTDVSEEFNLFKLERRLISKALTQYGKQGLEVVSEKLGISRMTLFRKRKQYDIN